MESISVETANEIPLQSTRPKSFLVPVVFEKEDDWSAPEKAGVCLEFGSYSMRTYVRVEG